MIGIIVMGIIYYISNNDTNNTNHDKYDQIKKNQ